MSKSSTLEHISLDALEVAALFASTDQARGVINCVAVHTVASIPGASKDKAAFSETFYVGTDSHVLGVVSTITSYPPAAMIATLNKAGTTSSATLIPAGLVHKAYKLAGPVRRWDPGLETVRFELAEMNGSGPAGRYAQFTVSDGSVCELAGQGDYPNFVGLLQRDQPLMVDSVSYNPDKLAVIFKAAKVLSGSRDDTIVSYFGQSCGNDKHGSPLRAGYWYATGDHGTLLAIAMPIRNAEGLVWS